LGQAELLMALAILGIGLALASLPAWRMQRAALSAAMKEY
jgi:putative ABC transport system permease protein